MVVCVAAASPGRDDERGTIMMIGNCIFCCSFVISSQFHHRNLEALLFKYILFALKDIYKMWCFFSIINIVVLLLLLFLFPKT